MAKQTQATKAVSFNETLIGEVEILAATNDDVKKALSLAVDTGKVFGAMVHGADASKQVKALGDVVAATITASQSEDATEASKGAADFRLAVGMANAAIKAAQTVAKRLAIGQHKAAELNTYAKKARDRIVKALDRHLALYGVKVDWQAVTFEPIDVPDEVTEADRAAKAVASAFALSGAGALQGVLALPSQTLVALAAAVQTELARQALEAAQQKVADKANEAVKVLEQVRTLAAQPQPDRAAIKQGRATFRAIMAERKAARAQLAQLAA